MAGNLKKSGYQTELAFMTDQVRLRTEKYLVTGKETPLRAKLTGEACTQKLKERLDLPWQHFLKH